MRKVICLILAVAITFCLGACTFDNTETVYELSASSVETLPKFNGMAYVKVNDNVPGFSKDEITTQSFEKYSSLDYLGRCGTAIACVGKDIMPTEERGEIGMVKPTGWHTVKYEVVDGNYLYNRCHLIGFQLTGENANEKNLVTGTRFLNIEGMLPFENMIADYVRETGNHVMYRVTPIFRGVNLLCDGVQMEGYSVEDKGEGICFNVFAYNAQPQVEINYLTGESALISSMLSDGENFGNVSYSSEITTNQNYDTYSQPQNNISSSTSKNDETAKSVTYILNKNSKKIHLETCTHAKRMKEENREEYKGKIDKYVDKGYALCQTCMKDK